LSGITTRSVSEGMTCNESLADASGYENRAFSQKVALSSLAGHQESLGLISRRASPRFPRKPVANAMRLIDLGRKTLNGLLRGTKPWCHAELCRPETNRPSAAETTTICIGSAGKAYRS
jgi:hypothetical protein